MLFEEILRQLGEFGKYQRRYFVFMAIRGVITTMHNMNIVFILALPNYRCAIPGFPNDTYEIQNEAHAAVINATIPPDDSCHVYNWIGDNNQTTVPCDAWVYGRSVFTETAVTEFNLVCQHAILKSITTMMYYVGMLFGGLIGGKLADRYGRKLVAFISIIGFVSVSFSLAASPNVYALMAFRFFTAFVEMSCYAAMFVLGMEIVGPSKRLLAIIIPTLAINIGYCLVTPFAYLIRNWRYMQVGLAAPSVVLLAYWWILPESPRWLLNKGRKEESEKILRKVARVNGVTLPEKLFDNEPEKTEVKDSGSVFQMLKYRVLCWRTFIICFNWGAVSMIYYGLSLGSGKMAGDIFINFLVGGLIELPATCFVMFAVHFWGRKKPHASCMILAGLACLSSLFVMLFGNSDLNWLLLVLATTGKFGITAAFAIIYLYTAELNPTAVRTISVGIGSVCARIFTIVAPFIVDLGDLIGGPTAKILPMVLFGSISCTAGMLALLLPETQGRRLPETIDDALHYTRKLKVTAVDAEGGTKDYSLVPVTTFEGSQHLEKV